MGGWVGWVLLSDYSWELCLDQASVSSIKYVSISLSVGKSVLRCEKLPPNLSIGIPKFVGNILNEIW